jgi:hypothetical protein
MSTVNTRFARHNSLHGRCKNLPWFEDAAYHKCCPESAPGVLFGCIDPNGPVIPVGSDFKGVTVDRSVD